MFANPLWSVLILLALVLIYRFIISPRLRVRFADTYSHIDSFWGRMKARIYAFRTPIVAAIGPVLTAIPDLLVKIPTMDLSFLPAPWPAWAMGFSTFAVIIMKAFETTPNKSFADVEKAHADPAAGDVMQCDR
jgi:hypothetical protein